MSRSRTALARSDYEALAAFRAQLRRFLSFVESSARAAGLTGRQHQLLLAIKGRPGGGAAGVGELAESLQVRHHAAVGLVDRCERAGLVRRHRAIADRRRVEVALTAHGERTLARLSAQNRQELEALRRALDVTRLRHRGERGR